MRKKFLEKKITKLEARKSALREKALASQDVNEVRSINTMIEDINDEIADCREEIAAIDADEQRAAAAPVEDRSQVPANARTVNGPTETFRPAGTEERTEDFLASMEYRRAFREYIMRGTPIESRNGEVISTVDTGAAIPITIMNEVINTVRKRYGNLYNKVRKTNLQGGVEYPIGDLKATFKWITEATVSPRQKLNKLGKIKFSYYTAEIRVAQTFLSQLLTLEAFEGKIAEVIAEAYLEAMDYGIVNGSGDGQMTGILNDSRVTNVVTMTAAQLSDWQAWRKNFFAKLPLGYRAGEFIFPLSTVESYLETMADANKNPIFRQATGLEVNDGDAANPNGRFFGREVSIVEPEILPDFDTAASGDVIGIFWQPNEYAINENFGFTMVRYFDQETNEWVDKALVVVDGKVLNPTGFYLIKKA